DFETLYHLYLIDGLTPGEAIRRKPALKPRWYDAPDGQYGRPAAFFQQLQRLNLAEAWSHVAVPTLAIHGEYDWIMSGDDHADAHLVHVFAERLAVPAAEFAGGVHRMHAHVPRDRFDRQRLGVPLRDPVQAASQPRGRGALDHLPLARCVAAEMPHRALELDI